MGAPLDLIGQRFHRLTVMERIPSTPERRLVLWRCRCDCGNIKDFTTGELRSGRTHSCGCFRQEITKRITSQPYREKLGMTDNTNYSRISSNKPSKNNKTNMRGVSKYKDGKYVAFIYFKKKRTYLGTYKTAVEAKAAYDAAWEERQAQIMREEAAWSKKGRPDITGQTFGQLLATQRIDDDTWHCKCSCGNECDVSYLLLVGGGTKSCGCLVHAMRAEDLTGKQFGLLTAIEYVGNRRWKCKCSCGNTTVVQATKLKSGHTRSCGCLRKK